jgi:hypothetical protein
MEKTTNAHHEAQAKSSNPKTLKLKTLGCFIFTHPIFWANNPSFLFHQK